MKTDHITLLVSMYQHNAGLIPIYLYLLRTFLSGRENVLELQHGVVIEEMMIIRLDQVTSIFSFRN